MADQIRILILEPGSNDDPIVCRIKTLPIDEAEGQYQAISYVWGRTGDDTDIECDGKRLSIKINLADALRTFRHVTHCQQFWADAVCINQKDHTEKGYQVRRMGDIFQKATQVLCWLGNDDLGIASSCFKFVREASKELAHQWQNGWAFVNLMNDLTLTKLVNDDTKQRWLKFASLLELSWFDRLWVVQEAGLARECILFWGKETVKLHEIMEVATWFANSVHAPVLEGGNNRTSRVITHVFLDIQCTYANKPTWRTKSPAANSLAEFYPKEKQLYVDLLFAARALKVTDLRDTVYASLGSPLALASDGNLMVEPNYREPLDELHIRIARKLLQNPREARHVLLRVIHNTNEELDDGFYPTWVPRWTMFSDTCIRPIPLTCSYEYRMKPYLAGRATSEFTIRYDSGRTITLTGLVFDTVAWVSLALKAHDLRSDAQQWDSRFRDSRTPAIEAIWNELLAQSGRTTEGLASDLSFTMCRARPGSENHVDNFLEYCQLLRLLAGSESPSPFPQPGSGKGIASDGEWAVNRCRDRRLAWTVDGRLALVPVIAVVGDTCCIVKGMDVPVLVRHTPRDTYKLVGEAYIHGVMEGELMEATTTETSAWRPIRVE